MYNIEHPIEGTNSCEHVATEYVPLHVHFSGELVSFDGDGINPIRLIFGEFKTVNDKKLNRQRIDMI